MAFSFHFQIPAFGIYKLLPLLNMLLSGGSEVHYSLQMTMLWCPLACLVITHNSSRVDVVCRELWKMKRAARKGRKWRRRLQGPNLSRQEASDSLISFTICIKCKENFNIHSFLSRSIGSISSREKKTGCETVQYLLQIYNRIAIIR